MRTYGGAPVTRGLTDEVILDFLAENADLAVAIERG
jgi:methanogenic corrinoid protein MtbC1